MSSRDYKKFYTYFWALGLAAIYSAQGAQGVGVGNDGGPSNNPKTGMLLKCKNEAAMKQDFLNQLLAHEVYGNANKVLDPKLKATTLYYQGKLAKAYEDNKHASPHLTPNLFSTLTKDKLYDGAKIFDPGAPTFQTGDILLSMTFLNAWNTGSFYSKRGMIHARMVLGTETNADGGQNLVILDGGWGRFSRPQQVASQSVWLRPKSKYFKDEDQQKFLKFAKLFEPVSYDNQLIDDFADFRSLLHPALDKEIQSSAEGLSREAQLSWRDKIAQDAEVKGMAPFVNGKTMDTFKPPSGFYCSEAGSAIYSYLGFRLYGETPFSMVTAFSPTGDLPSWAVYDNALEGFDASEGKALLLHQMFYNFFSVLDQAWKNKLIDLPAGYPADKAYNFADAMERNQKLSVDDGQADQDLLNTELNSVIAKAANNEATAALEDQAKSVLASIAPILEGMKTAYKRPDLNFTKAVTLMFFENRAYGPYHFLENGDFYDLMGVFYNSDATGHYQAMWVSDAGSDKGIGAGVNMSTTLYSIDPSANLGGVNGDECEISSQKLEANQVWYDR